MRELSGGGRGGGGTLVAAAVAVLERQTSTPPAPASCRTAPAVSVKTQTPQDNHDQDDSPTSSFERAGRKSASPLARSESFKKLLRQERKHIESDVQPEGVLKTPKASVIGVRLKQNAKLASPANLTDVDALCSDLMSNLEEALSSSLPPPPTSQPPDRDRDISKSSRSAFSYVDLRKSELPPPNTSNGVVLRRPTTPSTPKNGFPITNGASTSAEAINRNSSSTTTESAATSEDFEDSSDETGSETDGESSETETTSSEGEGVHVVSEGIGLETITEGEEERPVTANSVRSNDEYLEPGGDISSPEDDSTLKGHATWSGTASNHDSTSDLSTSSSEPQKNRVDKSSTCCNQDFQWLPKSTSTSPAKMDDSPPPSLQQLPANPSAKPPINRALRDRLPRRHASERDKMAPGSLDRRRMHNHHNRMDRDQKSKSTHVPKSPSRELDSMSMNHFPACQNWCCNPHGLDPIAAFENFHRRHERMDPQRYGSSSMLMEQQRERERERSLERSREREHRDPRLEFYHGSHPDLYSDYRNYNRHVEPPMGCCIYHTAPPCCRCGDSRNYRWTPPPPNKAPEHDDRIRRLQSENDNLQKEVFVLNERIDAQGERINELERALQEKKQQLGNTEDLLQREMLTRSSLETTKLELMSAMSEMKLQQAALERENLELRNTTHSQYNNNTSVILGGVKKPPLKPRVAAQPQHTSTPVLHHQLLSGGISPSASPVTGSLTSSLTSSLSQRRLDITSGQGDVQAPKTPPATYRRQVDLHYGSLPRQQFLSNGGAITLVDTNANPAATTNGTGAARKGVAFAETEKIVIEDMSQTTTNVNDSSTSLSPQPSPSLNPNKNKGIKKIFGRMKRSGSGNLEDLPGDGEFRRGGVRATAGPRLGWAEHNNSNNIPVLQSQFSKPTIFSSEQHAVTQVCLFCPEEETIGFETPDVPFADWDNDALCDWFLELGLDMYMTEAKRWIKNGAQLLSASVHDLEKELAIKNILHRKKLQLALADEQGSNIDPFLSSAGQLDTTWVLRWLDDTGLPQHKDAFLASRIDGRVLHRLTIDDLAILHVTSALHVASLRRGVQVLREHNFEPGCLQRRSLPDDPAQPTPQQLALWTTHRVMEWLRAVDLAEYAPNLRGAGVHGGLMIHEPKFTSELLATLLAIPPNKTLLRRHLNTHFKELLGRDVIQEKREAETTLGYTPLTPATKLKVTKKSQFSLKKKKDKGELDYGDLVCPLNNGSQSGESNGSSCTSRDSVGTMKTDGPKVEVVCHLVDDPALNLDECQRNTAPSPSPQRNLV